MIFGKRGKAEKSVEDRYFEEARSWETNRTEELLRSRAVAWRVAAAAGLVALAAVGAVAGLTPLKRVDPYVIRVDTSTGIVDVVEALKDGKTNYDEAVNKYFCQWYVRYREGFSRELAEEYYQNVGIMSVGLEQQKYYAWFNPKNNASPINIYGAYAKVKVHVKSTSFIKPNVALVRYTKAVERGLDQPELTHWAATITFRYSGAPMGESNRGINPLGFQVLEYRNDPDAMPGDVVLKQPAQEAAAPNGNGVTAFSGQGQAAQVPAIATGQTVQVPAIATEQGTAPAPTAPGTTALPVAPVAPVAPANSAAPGARADTPSGAPAVAVTAAPGAGRLTSTTGK